MGGLDARQRHLEPETEIARIAFAIWTEYTVVLGDSSRDGNNDLDRKRDQT